MTASSPDPGAPVPVGQAWIPPENAWHLGVTPAPPSRRSPWRASALPVVGLILVALISASGAEIWLRLQLPPPLRVTSAAITSHSAPGCTVDVTGRIGTTGGAGIVRYQWVFSPQLTVPRILSRTVAARQSAVYVTAVIKGKGPGLLGQQVTLQILGPGQGSASAHVFINC